MATSIYRSAMAATDTDLLRVQTLLGLLEHRNASWDDANTMACIRGKAYELRELVERFAYDAIGETSSEIFYTGGGIFCAVSKVGDGWFGGDVNNWGCIYSTREAAIDCVGEDDPRFIRYITDRNELLSIWRSIYSACDDFKDYQAVWIKTLESDIKEV